VFFTQRLFSKLGNYTEISQFPEASAYWETFQMLEQRGPRASDDVTAVRRQMLLFPKYMNMPARVVSRSSYNLALHS